MLENATFFVVLLVLLCFALWLFLDDNSSFTHADVLEILVAYRVLSDDAVFILDYLLVAFIDVCISICISVGGSIGFVSLLLRLTTLRLLITLIIFLRLTFPDDDDLRKVGSEDKAVVVDEVYFFRQWSRWLCSSFFLVTNVVL